MKKRGKEEKKEKKRKKKKEEKKRKGEDRNLMLTLHAVKVATYHQIFLSGYAILTINFKNNNITNKYWCFHY